MKSFKLLGAMGLMTVAAAACSGSTDTGDTSGAGGSGGATASNGVGPSSSVAGPTSSVAGPSSSSGMTPADESKSCADAIALKAGKNNQSGVGYLFAEGVLAEPNDKDFFTFTAKKGDWINVGTQANPDDDPMLVDTVVTLLSEDGKTVFAEVDDSFPRVSTDSNFDFRVPADGTYCLQVQEFSAWAGMDPEGDPTYQYAAVVIPYDDANLTAAFDGYSFDKEPNDTVGDAQSLATREIGMAKQVGANFFGLLDPKTDKDIFSVKTPAGAVAGYLNFQPSGTTNGNGSTGNIGLVNVWNAMGTTLLAQLDYGQATAQVEAGGSYGFSSIPLMANTTYLIEVNRKAGADAGANDFYAFTTYSVDAMLLNPQETDDTLNATLAGAEATMPQVNQDDPTLTNRFIGGGIPAGDTDYWKLEVDKDDKIIVVCSARRAGAGVADFTVELIDPDKTTSLQKEVEDPSKDLLWSDEGQTKSMNAVKAAKTGTYYVKLSATKAVTGGATLAWYQCGLHTQTP